MPNGDVENRPNEPKVEEPQEKKIEVYNQPQGQPKEQAQVKVQDQPPPQALEPKKNSELDNAWKQRMKTASTAYIKKDKGEFAIMEVEQDYKKTMTQALETFVAEKRKNATPEQASAIDAWHKTQQEPLEKEIKSGMEGIKRKRRQDLFRQYSASRLSDWVPGFSATRKGFKWKQLYGHPSLMGKPGVDITTLSKEEVEEPQPESAEGMIERRGSFFNAKMQMQFVVDEKKQESVHIISKGWMGGYNASDLKAIVSKLHERGWKAVTISGFSDKTQKKLISECLDAGIDAHMSVEQQRKFPELEQKARKLRSQIGMTEPVEKADKTKVTQTKPGEEPDKSSITQKGPQSKIEVQKDLSPNR